MRVLRQKQYTPYSGEEEVILLVSALNRIFLDVPEKKINDAAAGLLTYFKKNRPDIGDRIKGGEGLPDDLKKEILSVAQEYMTKQFQ
jgi:F0F1-type ATP synthase alpha subunit